MLLPTGFFLNNKEIFITKNNKITYSYLFKAKLTFPSMKWATANILSFSTDSSNAYKYNRQVKSYHGLMELFS